VPPSSDAEFRVGGLVRTRSGSVSAVRPSVPSVPSVPSGRQCRQGHWQSGFSWGPRDLLEISSLARKLKAVRLPVLGPRGRHLSLSQ